MSDQENQLRHALSGAAEERTKAVEFVRQSLLDDGSLVICDDCGCALFPAVDQCWWDADGGNHCFDGKKPEDWDEAKYGAWPEGAPCYGQKCGMAPPLNDQQQVKL